MSNTKTRVCAGVLLFCLPTLSANAMISRAESGDQVMWFDQQYPEKPPDDPFKARLMTEELEDLHRAHHA